MGSWIAPTFLADYVGGKQGLVECLLSIPCTPYKSADCVYVHTLTSAWEVHSCGETGYSHAVRIYVETKGQPWVSSSSLPTLLFQGGGSPLMPWLECGGNHFFPFAM